MAGAKAKARELRVSDARLFKVSDKVLRKYSEDQPRDEAGRWTSGGGGGEPTRTDIKAGMDSRPGWRSAGPNRWVHENGSRVTLASSRAGGGATHQYGGTMNVYSKDGRLSNMGNYAGDKATWMVGHNITGDHVEQMVSSVERGGNQLREGAAAAGASGAGTQVQEGWQVGLGRSDGSAVTDHAEAQDAMRTLFPEASGAHWDAALGNMQHEGDGVWIAPLPQDHADTLQNEGYLDRSAGKYNLQAEMP